MHSKGHIFIPKDLKLGKISTKKARSNFSFFEKIGRIVLGIFFYYSLKFNISVT